MAKLGVVYSELNLPLPNDARGQRAAQPAPHQIASMASDKDDIAPKEGGFRVRPIVLVAHCVMGAVSLLRSGEILSSKVVKKAHHFEFKILIHPIV